MANPNIVNVATINGKTFGAALTTTDETLMTGSSNIITKVNSVYVSNIDTTQAQAVTLKFHDSDVGASGTDYHLAKTVSVPANATLLLISKNEAIYLEEGDELKGFAGANGDLEIIISYEEIS